MADEPNPQPAAPQPEPSPQPQPTPSPQAQEDWRDRRLAQQTAKLRDLERQLAEARAAPATPSPSADPPGTLRLTQAELDARVSAAATQRVALERFQTQCTNVTTAGRAAFPDFDLKVQTLGRLINQQDPAQVSRYNEMLSTVFEAGGDAAHKIVHALGSDPNRAAQLLEMPTARMAVEVTKLANAAVPLTSQAPRPISPTVGVNAVGGEIDPADPERSDNLSTEEFMRRRNASAWDRREASPGRRTG